MFTGIVEAVGEIADIGDRGGFRQLQVKASGLRGEIGLGSSILTDGVCVTASALTEDGFSADLSRETLGRTTLGQVGVGDFVNLELAMGTDSRFGGHIVQGHVDEVGRISRFERAGDDWVLEVSHEQASSPRLVWKGSIAVDGISLTVASLSENAFTAAIIPFTLEHTNLSHRKVGDRVNLEFDVLFKYVEKLIEPYLDRIRAVAG